VTRNAVGTMTVTFPGPNTGTLTYTVNGLSVTKSIVRFTFRNEILSGNYLGGLTANATGCSGVTNGPVLIFGNLGITQNSASVTMQLSYTNGGIASQCVYSGALQSAGRLGNISGTVTCTTGSTTTIRGSFTLSNVVASQTGFSGTYLGSDNFCSSNSGQFGGVKDIF
jgi:hypothetical protein